MKPIPFSYVNTRKLSMKNNVGNQKISYRTVAGNLNTNNLLLFVESSYNDEQYLQSLSLYNRLLSEQNVSSSEKVKIENVLVSNLTRVNDLNSVFEIVAECDCIEDKDKFFNSLNTIDCCDRVLRNETKITKRFDFGKTINDNIFKGTKHTVFELCSLLDTYNISPKAKLNIALENISYALFKSGHDIDLSEAAGYIVEFFLTRESVITDKDYDGYIDVLKSNRFIDNEDSNFSYVFQGREIEGTSFKDKASVLITQAETKDCASHMSDLMNIKSEKNASAYIDKCIDMIKSDTVTKNDSLLLLKSIYCLPLIGNINKEFIDYKMELSGSKLDIKKKLTGIENEKIVRDVLDDGELLEYAQFISESVHFPSYILDDSYENETDPVKLLEASGTSDEIKDIINSFKASNEKSIGKFKNMISRIMVKSPENIIDETPNIFAAVRVMLYLAVGTTSLLGPVFAVILALVGKLLSTHMELKQAEKLLRHLRSEKEKAEKKLSKLSGKEKSNQEEYIDCIKKCISKVEKFISEIDDENEELNNSDDDDFEFGEFDFNFESAVETGSLFDTSFTTELIDNLTHPVDEEILTNIAVLFDNCPIHVANEFYAKLDELGITSVVRESANEEEEVSFSIQYEAVKELKKINKNIKDDKKSGRKDKFSLETLKMTLVNFKKKFRDLRGKEQELWRNIDIASSQLYRGIQKALTSDRREAIIKGSIIPSLSKCIKFAISVGGIGYFTGPVGAAISAVGMLGASKILNERERRLLYDEIETELQVVEKQIQLAENEGNMNQYRFLLNYQKKLKREKYRIKYGMQMQGRSIPELKGGSN